LRAASPVSWHRPVEQLLVEGPNDQVFWAVVSHSALVSKMVGIYAAAAMPTVGSVEARRWLALYRRGDRLVGAPDLNLARRNHEILREERQPVRVRRRCRLRG